MAEARPSIVGHHAGNARRLRAWSELIEADFPARYFDVAIAEQTSPVQLACRHGGGKDLKPVVAIYSRFAGPRLRSTHPTDSRLQNLPVIFAVDPGAPVWFGSDGATHQGSYGTCRFLRCIPNMISSWHPRHENRMNAV